MSKWPKAKLGEVAAQIARAEAPLPGTSYRQVGVKLWGEGAYERESMDGAQTKYTQLFRTAAGDIIVNKIWARNGSVAVVPESLAGCYGSAEFPMFAPNRERLEPRWIHWLTKTRGFWMQCDEKSQGTSGKNRIKPEQFLRVEIPLPPLAEQRRVVARIEDLTAQLEVARKLRQQAIEETEALMLSEEMLIWPKETLSNAATLSEVTTYLARGRQSEQGDSKLFIIKSQHVQMGKYINTPLTLAPHVASKVRPEAIVQPKDVLIACSAAGCLGRVAFYDDYQKTASTDTHVAIARANQERILPEYLYAYLKGAQGQIQLRSREKGDWKRQKISFRLTELNVADMRKVPVPTPSLDEQRSILAKLQSLHSELDMLKRLQAETAAELDALLPSILDHAFKGEL